MNLDKGKTVNEIVEKVEAAYEVVKGHFHDHFSEYLNEEIIVLNLASMVDTNFDKNIMNDFVDRCIKYRLGLSKDAIKPVTSDVIYDIHPKVKPQLLSVPLDELLDGLMYSAYPGYLLQRFKEQMVANGVSDDVATHILKRLDRKLA